MIAGKFSRRTLMALIILIALIASMVGQLLPVAAAVPFGVGDVFAGVGAGKIKHFSPTGVFLEELDTATGSNEEKGMAFDSSGNLFVTNLTHNSMSKFNNGDNFISPFGSGFNLHPESIVFDAAGNLYVGQ